MKKPVVTDFRVSGYKIYVEFNEGEIRCIDFKNTFKDRDSVIINELLNDEELFRDIHIRKEDCTLEWGNGFDIDPSYLYKIAEGVKVNSLEWLDKPYR